MIDLNRIYIKNINLIFYKDNSFQSVRILKFNKKNLTGGFLS